MEFMQFTKPPNFCSIFFGVTTLSFRGWGSRANFFRESADNDGFVVRRRRSYLRSPTENGPGGVVKFFGMVDFVCSISANVAQSATTARNSQISQKIAINGHIIPQRMLHHKRAKTTQSPPKPPNCRARDPLHQRYRRATATDGQRRRPATGGEDVRTHAKDAKKKRMQRSLH